MGNPNSISQNRAEFYYARGDERLPIILADGSGDVDYPGGAVAIHVTREPEERAILEELALRELTGAALVDVCQNVTLTLEWAKQHFEVYQRNLRAEFARRLGGLEPDELILMSWRLVAALCGAPWSDIPHLAQLAPALSSDKAVGPWGHTSHPTCFSAGKALTARREEIRRLFVGAFALHDTFLDIERFRAVSCRTNPEQTLERIAVIPTTALGNDLDELKSQAVHLRAQLRMDLETLRTRLRDLREQCNVLGVIWQVAWDNDLRVLAELRSDTFSTLLESTERQYIQGAALLTKGCNIWTYQEWRITAAPLLMHPYWAACNTVTDIRQELLGIARRRAPRRGKLITGTRQYHALLAVIRAYEQEVRGGNDDTLAD